MSSKRLFAVALIAIKPDPLLSIHRDENSGVYSLFYDGDFEATRFINCAPEIALIADAVLAISEVEAKEQCLFRFINCAPEIALIADAVLAISEVEAKEQCLLRILETYPERDGWIAHTAHACVVTSSLLDGDRAKAGATEEGWLM